MSDVKLNDLSLAQAVRPAASSPSPEPRPVVAADQQPSIQRQSDSGSQPKVTTIKANQTQADIKDQRKAINDAVARLNDYVQNVQRDLQFELDDSSGKTVVTVFDHQSQEVVRQIPNDVILRLARNLQQDEPLSLFNLKV